MKILSFRDLRIWREAHELCLKIYEVTRYFPRDELYGLTSQLRRSSGSVAANIVEGMGRRSTKELMHFLTIARSSAQETYYHCFLARDLAYSEKEKMDQLLIRYEGLSVAIYSLIIKLAVKVKK